MKKKKGIYPSPLRVLVSVLFLLGLTCPLNFQTSINLVDRAVHALGPGEACAAVDVTDSIQPQIGRLMYDRRTMTNYVDIGLQNTSSESVPSPIQVIIESITDPTVTVANPDGFTGTGNPYFEYTISSGSLSAGETSSAKRWIFNNPGRKRFNFIIGSIQAADPQTQNQAPTADAGGPYSSIAGQDIAFSGAGSADPDNDALTYAWDFGDNTVGSGISPSHAYIDAGTFTVTLTVDDGHGGTDTAQAEVVVSEVPNIPPTANAGPDQTYTLPVGQVSMEITLDGSGSDDSDGSIEGFVWTGSPDPSDLVQSMVTLSAGIHTFSLAVTDDDNGMSDPDMVTITILEPPNLPPVADAGQDQTLTLPVGQTVVDVILDGSGSADTDGIVEGYEWTGDPDPADTEQPLVSLPAGTYTFTLIVTDDDNALSAAATVTIVVEEPPNIPPTADAGPDQALTLTEGQTSIEVFLNGSGSSDPDGTVMTYEWSGTPDPENTAEPGIDLIPGTYIFTLIVTDDDGDQSMADSVTIAVADVNHPPVMEPVSEQIIDEMNLLTFQVMGADPDGDTLSYSAAGLPEGAFFDAPNRAFSWTPTYAQAGLYIVTFTVEDIFGLTAAVESSIVVNNVNRPPALDPVSDRTISETKFMAFRISGQDPDNEDLTYTAGALPGGAAFDQNTRTFSWTPTLEQAGTYQVGFTVSDGDLTDALSVRIFVVNFDENNSPSLTHVENQEIDEDQLLAFQVIGSDPNGDALVYEAEQLPPGALFQSTADPDLFNFVWTPGYDRAGAYTVSVTARDPGGLSDTIDIDIRVNNVNRGPSLDPAPDRHVAETKQLAFQITGSDPDDDDLTYSAGNLPEGAAFDAFSQAFYWIPTDEQAGEYDVDFTVSDSELSDTHTVRITVIDFHESGSPFLGPVVPQEVEEGQPLAFQVTGVDPNDDPLTYTVHGLPSGASFVESGTDPNLLEFSWTPGFEQAGTYTTTVTAADPGGLSDAIDITILVLNVNRPPVLDFISDQGVDENAHLDFQMTGSDPDFDTLIFGAAGLPEGAVLVPETGAFSWTPTHDQFGSYQVMFSVNDGVLTAEQLVLIDVFDVNRFPVITTILIPDGQVDQIYLAQVAGIDPDGDPLTWEITETTSGAAIDGTTGQISWDRPSISDIGAYSLTVTVADGRDGSDSQVYGFNVPDSIPPAISINAPSQANPGTVLSIEALASDNDAVTAIEIDGIKTDLPMPYPRSSSRQEEILVPSELGPMTVYARTWDPSGNVAEAAASITIEAAFDDEPPEVTLAVPPSVSEGQQIRLVAAAVDDVGVLDITFSADGVLIGTVPAQTPFMDYTILAGAGDSSPIRFRAEARDFSGNSGDDEQDSNVVASGLTDTTPPAPDVDIPETVTEDDTIPVIVLTPDEECLAQIDVFVNHTLAASYFAPDPGAFDVPLPEGIEAGMDVLVEIVVTDCSGNQTTTTLGTPVRVEESGRGVIAGEVYDAATGLPLANAEIVLFKDGEAVDSAFSDESGAYSFVVEAGSARLSIGKADFTTVERIALMVADGAGLEALDARLTPVGDAWIAVSAALGGSINIPFSPVIAGFGAVFENDGIDPSAIPAGEIRLDIPAGALAVSQTVTLTQISPQGLSGLLPGGWSPVGVIEISPHNIGFFTPAELSIPNPLALDSSEGVILVRWDIAEHAWRAVSHTDMPSGNGTITAQIQSSGQFAYVLPDTLPQTPPDPITGELLQGVSLSLIPDPVNTIISPEPQIIFYRPGVYSDVGVSVSNLPVMISSGGPVLINIAEEYNFYSGSRIVSFPFVQDIVLYSLNRPELTAAFPVTPSYTFEPLTLDHGVIDVDVLAPTDDERALDVVGREGGIVSLPTGEAVILPEDPASEIIPVDLAPLSEADLGIDLPPALAFMGGIRLSFSGNDFEDPVTLSVPVPVTFVDQGQLLLVQLLEIQGATRMVLKGLGMVQDGAIVSIYHLPGDDEVVFDGIFTRGRYLFVQTQADAGFVRGIVFDTSDTPLEGAMVSSEDMAVISASGPEGEYVAAVNTGMFTLTALDPQKMDNGSISGIMVENGEVSQLDIFLIENPPHVVSFSPADGAVNVPLETAVKVSFSEPLDASTVIAENLMLTGPEGPVAGTLILTSGGTQASFRPLDPLTPNTLYIFTITTGIRDLAGYAPESRFTFSFTGLDTLPPLLPPAGSITASIPDEETGKTQITTSQGTAGPHDTVSVVNKTQGTATPVLVEADGSFSVSIYAGIIDDVVISITDPAGNETVVSVGAFRNPDGSTVIGPEGGQMTANNGVIVDIPPGAFPNSAIVKLTGLSEAEMGIPGDPNFPFVAGFEIESSVWPAKYLNASAPAPSGASPDAMGIVGMVSEAFGKPAFAIVDTAKIIGGRLTTSSPPCPGIVARVARYGMFMNGHPNMATHTEQALLSIVAPSSGNWVMDPMLETEMERYSTYYPMYEDTFRGIYHASARPASQEYAGEAYEEMHNSLCVPVPANEPLKVVIRDLDTGDVLDVLDIDPVLSGEPVAIDYNFDSSDTVAPAVIEVRPINNVLDIYNPTVQIKFSEPISHESVSDITLVSVGENIEIFEGNWELRENNSLFVFETIRPLPMGKQYRLDLIQVEDMAGNRYNGREILFSTFIPSIVFPTPEKRLDRNAIMNDLGVNAGDIPENLWLVDVDFVTRSPEESADGKWHTDLVAIQAGEETGYGLFYMDLSDPTDPFVKSASRVDSRFAQKRVHFLDDVLITPRPDASGDPAFWKERELHYRLDDPSIHACANPGSTDLAAWREKHCSPDPDNPAAPVCGITSGGCGDLAVTAVSNTKYSYLWSYDVTDYNDPTPGNRIKWVSSRMLSDNGVAHGDIRHYEAPAGMGFPLGLTAVPKMDIFHNGMLNEKTPGAYVANYKIGLELVDLGLNMPTINEEDRRPESPDSWAIAESIKPNIHLYYRDVSVVDGKVVAIASQLGASSLIRSLEIFRPDLAGEPTGITQLQNIPMYMTTVADFPVFKNNAAEPELVDLAFVTGEDGGISVVEIPEDGSDPQRKSFIRTPPGVITKQIQVDREARVAYVSALGVDPGTSIDHLLAVDLSQPFTPLEDKDRDGWSDRIFGKIPIVFPFLMNAHLPVYLHGFRLDADRGLIYAGIVVSGSNPDDKHGLMVIKIRECNDLGIDFKAKPGLAPPPELEKLALQQVIQAGLTAGAAECLVDIGEITMIEQGSGSCIWKEGEGCGTSYQPGVSDHDFEVFFPAAIPEARRQCVINALYDQIVTPMADPIPIDVQGYKVAFDDVSFYHMVRENFEAAVLDVAPPTGEQGDVTGDMGLGRQMLLLKWLMEGRYVDVPGMDLKGKDFEEIFDLFKQPWDFGEEGTGDEPTHIPRLEGYEWARLQEAVLYKAGALIRIKGASEEGTTLYEVFDETLHKVAKAAIRAVLARVIAEDEGNRLAVDFEYNAPVCFDVESGYVPQTWESIPCDSFAHYIASLAARMVRDHSGSGEPVFTPEDVVDKIYKFYGVKSGKQDIETELEANQFISMAVKFIKQVGVDTLSIYETTIENDPQRLAQRRDNMTAVQQRIIDYSVTGKKQVVPRVFNKGPVEADASIWATMFTGTQATGKENVSPEPGAYVHLDVKKDPPPNPDNPDDLLTRRQNKKIFEIGANQTSPGQTGWVSFFVDIPDRSIVELSRENNWGKVFYYVLDPDNPSEPAPPGAPGLDELFNQSGDDLLAPDPMCGCELPDLLGTQSVNGVSDPDAVIPVYTGQGSEVCFTVNVTIQNLSEETYYDIRIISFYGGSWEEKGRLESLAREATHEATFTHCLPAGAEGIQGQVGIYYKTDQDAPGYTITGSNLLNIGVFCPKALIPHDPDPNPETSEVKSRGTAYRYYKMMNPGTGEPYVNETVQAELVHAGNGPLIKTTYTTDVDGEVGTMDTDTVEFTPGVKLDWDLLTAGMVEVDYSSPVTVRLSIEGSKCVDPIEFQVTLKEFDYEETMAVGGSVDLGASFAFVEGTLGSGATLDLGMKMKKEGPVQTLDTFSFRGSSTFNSKLGVKFELVKVKAKLGSGIGINGSIAAGGAASYNSATGAQYDFPNSILENGEINLVNEMSALIFLNLVQNQAEGLLSNHVMKEVFKLSDTPLYTYRSSSFSNWAITPEAGAGASFSAGIDLGDSVQMGISAQAAVGVKSSVKYEREELQTLTLSSEELFGEINATAGIEAGMALGSDLDDDDLRKAADFMLLNASATASVGSGIKVLLTLDKTQDYFPKQIDVTCIGEKKFGWKVGVGETELAPQGEGEQADITFTVTSAEAITKVAQNISDYAALLGNARKGQMDITDTEIVVGPTIGYERLMEFLVLMFGEDTLQYSVTKKSGRSEEIAFGLAGTIVGFGAGLDLQFKADNFTKYVEESGVYKRGSRYLLEEYKEPDMSIPGDTSSFQKPTRGETLVVLNQIKNQITASIADTIVDVVRECNAGGGSLCTIKTLLSSELGFNNQADFDATLGPISFGFEEIPGPVQSGYYSPTDTYGPEGKPHYGVGGFHVYYPKDQALSEPATLILDYYDHEMAGVDESTMAIYRLNEETRRWELVGGDLVMGSNTVTAEITQLGAYTLAPAMPGGEVAWGDQQIVQAGADTTITLTSNPLLMNNGDPVPDGTLFHVLSVAPTEIQAGEMVPVGTIITDDARQDVEGIQVMSENGAIHLEASYPADLIPAARIVVFSDVGTTFGDEVILLDTP